jgi:hypothetical protein
LEKPKGYETFLKTPFGTDEDVFCLEYETALKDVIFNCKANVFSDEHIRIDFENGVSLHWYKGSFDSYQGNQIQSYSDLTKYNLPLNEKGCEKFKL